MTVNCIQERLDHIVDLAKYKGYKVKVNNRPCFIQGRSETYISIQAEKDGREVVIFKQYYQEPGNPEDYPSPEMYEHMVDLYLTQTARPQKSIAKVYQDSKFISKTRLSANESLITKLLK